MYPSSACRGGHVTASPSVPSNPPLPAFSNVVAAYGLNNFNPVGYPAPTNILITASGDNGGADYFAATLSPYGLFDFDSFFGNAGNPPYTTVAWPDQNSNTNNLTSSGANRPTLQVTTPVVVTGIGAGTYTYRGQANGFAYYNLQGQTTDESRFAIVDDGSSDPGQFKILDFEGTVLNQATVGAAFPWLASWTGSTVTAGTQKGEIQFVGTTPTGLTGASPLFSGGSAVGTLYIPFKATDLIGTGVVLETGDGAGGSARRISIRMVAGVLTVSCFDATAVVALANTKIKTISDNNWHIATVRFDTSLSAANQIQLLVDNSATGVTAPISTDLSGLLLGNGVPNVGYRNAGASAGFTGSMYDVLAFSAAHNSTLETQWYAYLAYVNGL